MIELGSTVILPDGRTGVVIGGQRALREGEGAVHVQLVDGSVVGVTLQTLVRA